MHRTSTKAALSWLALTVFVSISQPAGLPVWGLIIPFVLLYFALRNTVALVLERPGRTDTPERRFERRLPEAAAMSLILVLALQSIGQLTVRDVLAVISVVMLGYFYIHRNGSKQNK